MLLKFIDSSILIGLKVCHKNFFLLVSLSSGTRSFGMIGRKLILVLSIFSVSWSDEFGEKDDQLIKSYVEEKGYAFESHQITTTDGYLLKYHRISTLTGASKSPVLLQHGLGLSSAAFLIPDKDALAYVLADAGHDVWLANSRGNRYSRRHLFINSSSDKEYWQFSIDEMAVKDTSAALIYILHTTKESGLHFIGHSHGGAFILALLSSKPYFQSMYTSVTLLAPTTILSSELKGTTKHMIATAYLKSRQYENSGRFNMFSKIDEMKGMFCEDMSDCNKIVNFLTGTSDEIIWRDILQFEPSGTSTAFIQYVFQQGVNSQTFKHHDYGVEENQRRYNTSYSPTYNLSVISNPIDIIYTGTDLIVSHKDIEYQASILKMASLHRIKTVNSRHLDFLWDPNTKKKVNAEVLSVLNRDRTNTLKRKNWVDLKLGKNYNNISKIHIQNKPSKSILDSGSKAVLKDSNMMVKQQIYDTFVERLLTYEQKTNVSLLYVFLTSNTPILSKFKVLNEVVTVLNDICSNTETNKMVQTIKSLREQSNIFSPIDRFYLSNSKIKNSKKVKCPTYSIREEYIHIINKLENHKTKIGSLFDYSILKSTNVSNVEKIELLRSIAYYLKGNCKENCVDFIELVGDTNTFLSQINRSNIDTVNLSISNETPNKNTSSDLDEISQTLQQYLSIINKLSIYESKTHSVLDYSPLLATNKTNKEKLHILEQFISTLNNQCTGECKGIQNIALEMKQLKNNTKRLSNIEKINMSASSIKMSIDKLNNETAKSMISHKQGKEKEIYLIIVNKIIQLDTNTNRSSKYGFLESSQLSALEKKTRLLEIISSLKKQCAKYCQSFTVMEGVLRSILNDSEIYSDAVFLNCTNNGLYCEVEQLRMLDSTSHTTNNCTDDDTTCATTKYINTTSINTSSNDSIDITKDETTQLLDKHNNNGTTLCSEDRHVKGHNTKFAELGLNCEKPSRIEINQPTAIKSVKKRPQDNFSSKERPNYEIPTVNMPHLAEVSLDVNKAIESELNSKIQRGTAPVVVSHDDHNDNCTENSCETHKNTEIANNSKSAKSSKDGFYDIQKTNCAEPGSNCKPDSSLPVISLLVGSQEVKNNNCTKPGPDCESPTNIDPTSSLPEETYVDHNIICNEEELNCESPTKIDTATNTGLVKSSEQESNNIKDPNCKNPGQNCKKPSTVETTSLKPIKYDINGAHTVYNKTCTENGPNCESIGIPKINALDTFSKERYSDDESTTCTELGINCNTPTIIETSDIESVQSLEEKSHGGLSGVHSVYSNCTKPEQNCNMSMMVEKPISLLDDTLKVNQSLAWANLISNSTDDTFNKTVIIKSSDSVSIGFNDTQTINDDKYYEHNSLKITTLNVLEKLKKFDPKDYSNVLSNLLLLNTNTSYTKALKLILQYVTFLKYKCTNRCKELYDFEQEIKLLLQDISKIKKDSKLNCSQLDPSCILDSEASPDNNNTTKNTSKPIDRINLTEVFIREELLKVFDQIRKYDKITSTLNHSFFKSRNNIEIIEFLLSKVGYLNGICTEKCEYFKGLESQLHNIKELLVGAYQEHDLNCTPSDPTCNINVHDYQPAVNDNFTALSPGEATKLDFELDSGTLDDNQYVQEISPLNAKVKDMYFKVLRETITYMTWQDIYFIASLFLSNSTSSIEKLEILQVRVRYLKNECMARCEVLDRLLNDLQSTSNILKDLPNSKQLIIPGAYVVFNADKYDQQLVSEDRLWETLKRKELTKIVQKLINYESKMNTTSGFSSIDSATIFPIELYSILISRIQNIKGRCVVDCVGIDDLEGEIREFGNQVERKEIMKLVQKLMNYELKVHSNFNYSFMYSGNISTSEISFNLFKRIKNIKEICGELCESINNVQAEVEILDKEVERKEINKIVQTLMKYESVINSDFRYSFIDFKSITTTEKINILFKRVRFIKGKCFNNCGILDYVENELEKLKTQIERTELIKIVLKLMAFESKIHSNFTYDFMDSTNISTIDIDVILFKRIMFMKESCRDNWEGINYVEAQLERFDKQLEKKVLNKFVQKLKSYDLKLQSTFSYSFVDFDNITMPEIDNLLFKRITYIREKCVENCEDINKVENELGIIDSKAERKELIKIVLKLLLFESKINSNFSYLFIDFANMSIPKIYGLLFKRIKYIKENCNDNCEGINDVENKVKRLHILVQRKELFKIMQRLKQFESNIRSKFSYSFMDSATISARETASLLLKRLRYVKEKCGEGCKGISGLEKEILEIYNPAAMTSDINQSKIHSHVSKNHLIKPTSELSNITKSIKNAPNRMNLKKLINQLKEYEMKINSDSDYSFLESLNFSDSQLLEVLLLRIGYLKYACNEHCEDINDIGTEIEQQYGTTISPITLGSTMSNENNRTNLLQFITKENYVNILNKVYWYDLKHNIYPLNYSFLSSTSISDTDKIEIILKKLLTMEKNCNETCEEIHKLVKKMRVLRFRLQTSNNDNKLNLTEYDLPSTYGSEFIKASDIYLSSEYHRLKDEYINIVRLLRNYETTDTESSFSFSVLELPGVSSIEKLSLLTERITYLNNECIDNCAEIQNLAENLQTFQEDISDSKKLSLNDIDLSIPKLTYRSWFNSFNHSSDLLDRVRTFIKRINFIYLDK